MFIFTQLSAFGGPAWVWNQQRNQFYFHQFGKAQPDFDLRNPDVKLQLLVSCYVKTRGKHMKDDSVTSQPILLTIF